MSGVAVAAALTVPTPVIAQEASQLAFAIPAKDLAEALNDFSRVTGLQVAVRPDLLRGRRSQALNGQFTPAQALQKLTAGSGVEAQVVDGAVLIRVTDQGARPAAPSDAPIATPRRAEAAGDDAIIVTARRRAERIIDVPLAVTAFSEEQLDERKIEGGSELLRAIPNVNFSKDNFTGYNFVIRGIGAKVLAATADPGVAISFNSTPLIRNRLFEQEYFDVERVEVLRGPQGTLYGRNATAGVVNMLPHLPEIGSFDGNFEAEGGNYEARRFRGHINIPLGDTLAVRIAGASTEREGFDYNTVTDRRVNGRELWSGRLGVAWEPTESFRANFMWEHFNEDDDRARTGKMLCTREETPTNIEWTDPSGAARSSPVFTYWTTGAVTPNCAAKSLYSNDAFGMSSSIGWPMTAAILNLLPFSNRANADGYDGNYLFPQWVDPFATEGNRQVADLRAISTAIDPKFQAENDVFQFNFDWDVTSGLTLSSQTLYSKDTYSGTQDFFRAYATGQMYRPETMPTRPAPTGRPGTVLGPWQPWFGPSVPDGGVVYASDIWGHNICGPLPNCGIPTGGVFLDPQLGATDRFMAMDRSEAESTQMSQEFRLQSDFSGPFNFNLGANWMKYETEENYYVFSNAFTMMAVADNYGGVANGYIDQYGRLTPLGQQRVDAGLLDPNSFVYIDPNPLGQIDGQGHNYLRNISINTTESWAIFGEGYYNLTETLRVTLGLRYTDDTKTLTPVPSQLLASTAPGGSGLVGRGYPRMPDQQLNWGEWSGRAAVDWRPNFSFTDDTLFYASFARGYKAGGGNPRDRDYNPNLSHYPSYPSGYDPEFINAYEIGTKNVFGDGKFMFNANAFFYDYKDYQVAHVIDRVIHNENFDTKVWGAEFEAAWSPSRNFRIDATLGLLRTRIGDGEKSIDVMDRLQGNKDWIVVKPWPTSPSTCVVPREILGRYIEQNDVRLRPFSQTGSIFVRELCIGPQQRDPFSPTNPAFSDVWGPITYDPLTGPNEGRGFSADLSGNELPNAPHMTFNIGAQYRLNLPGQWDVTVRGDYYRQSDSWMRVYNHASFDRLRSWDNANLSATLTSPSSDFSVQAYVKNVFDDTPITDGFVGPDEVGNVTNVFTLDPRLVGVRVSQRW